MEIRDFVACFFAWFWGAGRHFFYYNRWIFYFSEVDFLLKSRSNPDSAMCVVKFSLPTWYLEMRQNTFNCIEEIQKTDKLEERELSVWKSVLVECENSELCISKQNCEYFQNILYAFGAETLQRRKLYYFALEQNFVQKTQNSLFPAFPMHYLQQRRDKKNSNFHVAREARKRPISGFGMYFNRPLDESAVHILQSLDWTATTTKSCALIFGSLVILDIFQPKNW